MSPRARLRCATGTSWLEIFEVARPRLLGLAYRMLGTLADAEDVVQEVWLKFQNSSGELDRPDAWLTTVTTRAALDQMKAIGRRRETYVGPWLPEPIVDQRSPEEAVELASTLTLGFLTLLDRLTPVQRAVFLLADVFVVPYAEIAASLGKTEGACRQIASRARHELNVPTDSRRRPTCTERRVVDGLLSALAFGDIAAALSRLSPEVIYTGDGGPTRRAARRPVIGSARVLRLLINLSKRYASDSSSLLPTTVNGEPGLIVSIGGKADAVLAFGVKNELVEKIWLVRNPDKLSRVESSVVIA